MAKFDLKKYIESRVQEWLATWVVFYFVLGILLSHGFWHFGITCVAGFIGMVLYRIYKKYW